MKQKHVVSKLAFLAALFCGICAANAPLHAEVYGKTITDVDTERILQNLPPL